MPNSLFKKGLVAGIIALFVGLAFIPSFNAVSISKDIEETNPVVDDSEEDCIECQSNGKTHLAEKLLNRLEKNEILSDVIDFANPDDRLICNILNDIIQKLWDLDDYYYYLLSTISEDSILYDIILFRAYLNVHLIGYFEGIGYKFNCWD